MSTRDRASNVKLEWIRNITRALPVDSYRDFWEKLRSNETFIKGHTSASAYTSEIRHCVKYLSPHVVINEDPVRFPYATNTPTGKLIVYSTFNGKLARLADFAVEYFDKIPEHWSAYNFVNEEGQVDLNLLGSITTVSSFSNFSRRIRNELHDQLKDAITLTSCEIFSKSPSGADAIGSILTAIHKSSNIRRRIRKHLSNDLRLSENGGDLEAGFKTFIASFVGMSMIGSDWNQAFLPLTRRVTDLDEDFLNNSMTYAGVLKLTFWLKATIYHGSRRFSKIRRKEVNLAQRLHILEPVYSSEIQISHWVLNEEKLKSLITKFIKGFDLSSLEIEFARSVVHNSPIEGIKAIAISSTVFLKFFDTYVILTKSDVENFEKSIISITSWNLYASTIKSDSHDTGDFPQVVAPPIKGTSMEETKRAWLALTSPILTKEDIDNAFDEPKSASISEVLGLIKMLWGLYMDVQSYFVSNFKMDYLGRFLYEVYGLYTAQFGSDIEPEYVHEQQREFVLKWSSSREKSYAHEIIKVLRKLPITEAKDFGNLAKISVMFDPFVPTHFLQTMEKSQSPNPMICAEHNRDVSQCPHRCLLKKELEFKSHYKAVCLSSKKTIRELQNVDRKRLDELVTDSESVGSVLYKDAVDALRKRLIKDKVEGYSKDFKDDITKEAFDFLTSHKLPRRVPTFLEFMDMTGVWTYTSRLSCSVEMLKDSAIAAVNLRDNLKLSKGSFDTLFREKIGSSLTIRSKNSPQNLNMLASFLLDELPTEQISEIETKMPATIGTAVKYESQKCPDKTRMFFIADLSHRLLLSDVEANLTSYATTIPGFSVGKSKLDNFNEVQSAKLDSTGHHTFFISLDLSSFSNGMPKRVQQWSKSVLSELFNNPIIENEATNTIFDANIFCNVGTSRFVYSNYRGANLEGFDGKDNTIKHLTLWYIARTRLEETPIMKDIEISYWKPMIYIDDGAAIIGIKAMNGKPLDIETVLPEVAKRFKDHLIQVYREYGFDLSPIKTVVSRHYMQFLNESYIGFNHISHGLRALNKIGSSLDAPTNSPGEELAAIAATISAANANGAHPLRTQVMYAFFSLLWMRGNLGHYGGVTRRHNPNNLIIWYFSPIIFGGAGCPDFMKLTTNLGNPAAHNFKIIHSMYKHISTLSLVIQEKISDAPRTHKSAIYNHLSVIPQFLKEVLRRSTQSTASPASVKQKLVHDSPIASRLSGSFRNSVVMNNLLVSDIVGVKAKEYLSAYKQLAEETSDLDRILVANLKSAPCISKYEFELTSKCTFKSAYSMLAKKFSTSRLITQVFCKSQISSIKHVAIRELNSSLDIYSSFSLS